MERTHRSKENEAPLTLKKGNGWRGRIRTFNPLIQSQERPSGVLARVGWGAKRAQLGDLPESAVRARERMHSSAGRRPFVRGQPRLAIDAGTLDCWLRHRYGDVPILGYELFLL